MISAIGIVGAASLLIWQGFHGRLVNGLPTQWLGYLMLACGAVFLVFNLWRGMPRNCEAREAEASPVISLSNVEQQGEDTHADIHVQSSWQNQMITVESPAGPPWQIHVPPGIQTGMFLRLHGESIYGPGFLLLRLVVDE